MNRTGLFIALAVAAVAGAVLALYPSIDLGFARFFYGFVDNNHNTFALRLSPLVMRVRDMALWVPTLLILPAVAAVLIKLAWPKRRLLLRGRAIVFMIVTLALGPGLLVNVALKDHWGRPRPIDVAQFGGNQHFAAWWDPRGDCPGNCSFVSGDVSGAFWTLAPAALTPPQWRAVAYGAALALGTATAALRLAAGAHFLSDVVFAGVFTFLVIWVAYGVIYRWPRTRLTDEGIAQALERISAAVAGFFAKRKSEL